MVVRFVDCTLLPAISGVTRDWNRLGAGERERGERPLPSSPSR